ncbi:protein kinase [uncultured Fibrella sp.]|uniref:serine/threonine protein kinase n=1 Tax=uncultured Fibrella sp. TaxID=1284596 RepID=UPI0035CBE0F5
MEYHKQQFLTYDEFTRQFACDYAMPLARGGHGEIYRGVDLETNEEVAIKRRLYSVDDNALTLEKEYANTQAVPVNRFVVRYLYYGRYATPFGTYEFLVMRYYRDGNLTNTSLSWNALSNLQQQRFVSEFLLGLSHLHTHGIVHRDIKPENVLLVRYSDAEGIAFRPVIVDFGISKMMTDHPEAARAFVQNSMRIGTVTYMAPEQLRTENIDYNADLWSFGIILYELITGKHMIARKSFPETQREEAYAFWRMANEEQFPDDLRTVPQPYQQMIRRCLIVSPDERVQSAKALLDLLELQPRIVEAEQAFRRQNWDVVIEALDPIVDRADIPELTVWLQKARMQAALSQPIERFVEEPQTEEIPEYIPEAEPADVPESLLGEGEVPANVPEPPAEPLENKPVPYTAQTELLEAPAEPLFPEKTAINDDDETDSVTEQELPEGAPEAHTEPITDNVSDKADVPITANEPAASEPLPITTNALAADEIDAEPPSEEAPITAHQPVTGQLTEAFVDEPVMNSATAGNVPDSIDHPVAEPGANNVPEPDDKEPQKNEQEEPADAQYTEAFAEPAASQNGVAHTVPETVAAVSWPETRQSVPAQTAAVSVPFPQLPKAPSPVSRLVAVTLESLKNRLDGIDSEQVKQRAGEVYEEAKKAKNRPLLIGGVVAVLLLLLFAIGPGQTTEKGIAQLDPNENYATSLKRFQDYSRMYEKTGDLNPYVWAFVHCNPMYDDSLRKSAVRRAELIRAQHELLFGIYSDDISKLKRIEMRKMSNNQLSWELRPHSLSDENCLPKK